jgi:hypothetical protein
MSDGRTRHTKRCTSHGGRSLNLVAHDLGAVEAAGECGELKGHKVLTDPRREGVEPSFSSLDYGTDRARHPFDRSVVFRRCRKIEDGAAILPSKTTLIVQSAPDVESFDNRRGRHAISGKARREERLPLPQEVGDALLAYIRHARPRAATERLFLTNIAPIVPLSRVAVKCLVRRALDRAGVEGPHRGAHVLRHTAATAMLAGGASLAGVGAVLRHRSPSMTAHYAKVDFSLLSEIAQPWGGRASC